MTRRFVDVLDDHGHALTIGMIPVSVASAWLSDFALATSISMMVCLMCGVLDLAERKPRARARLAETQASAAWDRLIASRAAAVQATELARTELAAAEELWRTRIRELEAARGGDEVKLARADVGPELERLRALARMAEEHHDDVEHAIGEYRALGTSAAQLIKRVPSFRVYLWLCRTARESLPTGLAAVAVAVAGQERAHMRDEWLADLAGAPEEGVDIRQYGQVRHARGLVKAALKYRLKDIVRPMWRPVDWVLIDESRGRSLIALLVGGHAIYIVWHGGLHTMLTEGIGWCAFSGALLFGLLRWLRGLRGIELAARQNPPDGE